MVLPPAMTHSAPDMLLEIQELIDNFRELSWSHLISQSVEFKEVVSLWLCLGACRQKDVKNEECSSEFVENKGENKVLLMVC